MLRKLLICGLLAGACGGLLAAGFAAAVGERSLDRAIAYEQVDRVRAFEHAHGVAAGAAPHVAAADPAPVSRSAQKSLGLATASVIYGLALGGIFALAFAVVYGRVARVGPRVTAYGLAGAAWSVVYLVPFLKYPANPPGASDPATIGRRTGLYATMIAISVLAAVAAARLRPSLARRIGGSGANAGALLVYGLVAVGGGLLLPSIDEVPRDFPASALWQFREASVGMQAVLWTAIGLLFAPAAARVLAGQPLWSNRTARVTGPTSESETGGARDL